MIIFRFTKYVYNKWLARNIDIAHTRVFVYDHNVVFLVMFATRIACKHHRPYKFKRLSQIITEHEIKLFSQYAQATAVSILFILDYYNTLVGSYCYHQNLKQLQQYFNSIRCEKLACQIKLKSYMYSGWCKPISIHSHSSTVHEVVKTHISYCIIVFFYAGGCWKASQYA